MDYGVRLGWSQDAVFRDIITLYGDAHPLLVLCSFLYECGLHGTTDGKINHLRVKGAGLEYEQAVFLACWRGFSSGALR